MSTILQANNEKKQTPYRIYKTRFGAIRKDGSRTMWYYGCNGKEHVSQKAKVWLSADGKRVVHAVPNGTKTTYLGRCDRTSCLNLGAFLA